MVVAGVDEGEDFEEGVVDSVDEGGVHVYEGDGGVFDCDFERFDERVDGHGGGFEALLVDFGLRSKTRVAGQGAEAVCPAEEDVRGGGFGDEEEHENEDGAGDPEDFPEGPAPSLGHNSEAGEEGPESGTAVGGGDPESERVGEVEERVHVLHCCAAVGEAGRAKKALQKTEDEEPGEVLDKGGGDGEDHEDEEGDGVDGTAAYERDFGEGSED